MTTPSSDLLNQYSNYSQIGKSLLNFIEASGNFGKDQQSEQTYLQMLLNSVYRNMGFRSSVTYRWIFIRIC